MNVTSPDNFGPGQTRVLNVEDRSLENVVFQYKTPPLSSEWNLINQISNEKIKQVVSTYAASGFINVGDTICLDKCGISEASAVPGEYHTSVNYSPNTFTLSGKGKGVAAVVNGWPIFITGSSSTNSIIELDPPTSDSYRYDFVFLEVWKKLIGENDPIYPYGNTDSIAYANNELVYSAIGAETTKRVQIQYRIRSVKFNSFTNFKEGFELGSVYPRGGRASEYKYSNYAFRAKGHEDPGLFISGQGTSSDQEILNTVDGYVYAIPMAIVYRRKQGNFSLGSIHSSSVNRQQYLNGTVSDRPDGKLLDVVYKDDIVDMRHRVGTFAADVKDIMELTFKKLVYGDLHTNIGKAFTDFSGGKAVAPGASGLFKVEQINGTGGNDIPNLSGGESSSSSFKRRVYTNGEVKSSYNVIKIPVSATSSTTWSVGSFDLSGYIPSSSVASISTVIGLYEPSLGEITNASYDINTKYINITTGSNIIGSTSTVYLHVDLLYTASNSGFRDVPTSIREVNKTHTVPYSSVDPIHIRYNLNGSLVNFDSSGKDTNDGETDERDYILNSGNNFSEAVNFGMGLTIHRPINTSDKDLYTVGLNDSKLYGYYILGVRSVYENIGTKENPDWKIRNFNFSRAESSVSPANPEQKNIDSYELRIDQVSKVNAAELKITLCVGSKPEYYQTNGSGGSIVRDDINSIKFFKFNRQARGIIDTYELIEAVALRIPGTQSFMLDTIDKPIIKLISKAVEDNDDEGDFLTGCPYVYDKNGDFHDAITVAGRSDINTTHPVTSSGIYSTQRTPTRIIIHDTDEVIVGDYIKVPVLVSSYVSANEQPYNIYYDFIPYQGLLSPTDEIYGNFLSGSTAAITSKGSGSEARITIGSNEGPGGQAKFTANSRFVKPISTGSGVPDWASYLDLDNYTYYIKIECGFFYYKIEKFAEDPSRAGQLVLNQRFRQYLINPSLPQNYEIVRLDVPNDNVSNIIDRMPTFLYEDYKGKSEEMKTSGAESSMVFKNALSVIHDPIEAVPGTFKIGSSSDTNNKYSRGVSNIILSSDVNSSVFKLAFKRPYIKYPVVNKVGSTLYKKVYQPYLFLKFKSNDVAIPYLAVISSESKNDTTTAELNNYTRNDTIDLFELVGRPLLKI